MKLSTTADKYKEIAGIERGYKDKNTQRGTINNYNNGQNMKASQHQIEIKIKN